MICLCCCTVGSPSWGVGVGVGKCYSSSHICGPLNRLATLSFMIFETKGDVRSSGAQGKTIVPVVDITEITVGWVRIG
jgi:hypothetical protein